MHHTEYLSRIQLDLVARGTGRRRGRGGPIADGGTGTTLARLARERRLTTLVWAGLQLGDAGTAQLPLLQQTTHGSVWTY